MTVWRSSYRVRLPAVARTTGLNSPPTPHVLRGRYSPLLSNPPAITVPAPIPTTTTAPALPQPCLLWALMGSSVVIGGGLTGTVVVKIGGSTQTLAFPATGSLVAATPYYVGNGGASDLLTLLATTLATFSGGPTWAVTQDNAGHVTITAGGGTAFQILPASTVDLTVFGLDNVATWSSASAALTGNVHKGAWYPGFYQEVDSLDALPFVGRTSQAISGVPRTVRIATTRKERDFGWRNLDAAVVRDPLAISGALYATFERAWEESIGYGYPFLYYPDRTVRTTTSFTTYELREDPKGWPWARADGDAIIFWHVDLMASRVS